MESERQRDEQPLAPVRCSENGTNNNSLQNNDGNLSCTKEIKFYTLSLILKRHETTLFILYKYMESCTYVYRIVCETIFYENNKYIRT